MEPKEAALSSTGTESTESEPEVVQAVPGDPVPKPGLVGVVPGDNKISKEDKRPRKVPQQKRRLSNEDSSDVLSPSPLSPPYRTDQLTTWSGDITPPLRNRERNSIPGHDRAMLMSTSDASVSMGSDSDVHETSSTSNQNTQSESQSTPVIQRPLTTSTPDVQDVDTTASISSPEQSGHTPMAPPMHPPLKHSSTSSSGTSSSYTMKTKGVIRIQEGESSSGMSDSPSLPHQTSTTRSNSVEGMNDIAVTTPSTSEESMETQDVLPPPSQDDLFRDSQSSSQQSINQMPQWMVEQRSREPQGIVCYSSTSNSSTSTGSDSDQHAHYKRGRTSSNGERSNGEGSARPPLKRQRVSVTPVSPDISEAPAWMKKMYHSTPGPAVVGSPSSIDLSLSSNDPPSNSGTNPTPSPASFSHPTAGSSSSLGSGYMASLSSGGGSSGFTPPQSVSTRELSSNTSSLTTQVTAKNKSATREELGKPDSNEDSTSSFDNKVQSPHISNQSADQMGGDTAAVTMAKLSYNPTETDDSAVAGGTSSNTNTPPLITPPFSEEQPQCDETLRDTYSNTSSVTTTTPSIEPPSLQNSENCDTTTPNGRSSSTDGLNGGLTCSDEGKQQLTTPLSNTVDSISSRAGNGFMEQSNESIELMETEPFQQPYTEEEEVNGPQRSEGNDSQRSEGNGSQRSEDNGSQRSEDNGSQRSEGNDFQRSEGNGSQRLKDNCSQNKEDRESSQTLAGTTGTEPVETMGTTSDPVTGASSLQTEPLTGTKPVQREPLTGTRPAQTEPSTGTRPVQTEPSTGTRPVQSEPETDARPVQTELSTGTEQVQNEPQQHLLEDINIDDDEDDCDGSIGIRSSIEVSGTQSSFALRLTPSQSQDILTSHTPSSQDAVPPTSIMNTAPFSPFKASPSMTVSLSKGGSSGGTSTDGTAPVDSEQQSIDDGGGCHGDRSHDIVIDLTQSHSDTPVTQDIANKPVSNPNVSDTLPMAIDLTGPDYPAELPGSNPLLPTTSDSQQTSQSSTPPVSKTISNLLQTHSDNSIPTTPRIRPLYESIQCSSSDDTPPLPSNSLTGRGIGGCSGTDITSDSNHSVSGTPFQFHLPTVGTTPDTPCIISRITPPSQQFSPIIIPTPSEPNIQHESSEPNIQRQSSEPNIQHQSSGPNLQQQSVSMDNNANGPITVSHQTEPQPTSLVARQPSNQPTDQLTTNEPSHVSLSEPVDEPMEDRVESPPIDHTHTDHVNAGNSVKPSSSIAIAPFMVRESGNELEGVNLDDSQNYEMPVITGMEDSEQDSCSSPNALNRRLLLTSHGSHDSTTLPPPRHTNPQQVSPDTSEDPFAFDSSSENVFELPVVTKRKPRGPKSRGRQLPMNTHPQVPSIPHSDFNCPPATSDDVTPTNSRLVHFNPALLTTPPQSQSSCSTPRRLDQSTPNITLATPPQSSVTLATPPSSSITSTPISFSSPSAFVQPHAIDSLFTTHPDTPYMRLEHVTTVTTVKRYVSMEIVERSSGTVVHTDFNEVVPQDQKQISFQAEPVYTLPTPPITAQTPPTTAPPHHFNPVSGTSHSAATQRRYISPVTSTTEGLMTTPTPATPTSPTLSSSSSVLSDTLTASRPPIISKNKGGRTKNKPNQRSATLVSPSNVTTSTAGAETITPGLKVIARWKNNRWYAAHVVRRVARKVCVAYMDGDRENVALNNLLPLDQLPYGTPVIADEDKNDPLTIEEHGSYQGFNGDTFKLTTSSGETKSCKLYRLTLNADTAEMVVKVATSSSSAGGGSPLCISTGSAANFFSGYVFLLTEKDQSSSDKREVIEQLIKSHGGFIMDDYKPTHVLDKKTFCLSNTHCRTMKYLIALAVNLPCVKYDWIKECVRQKKLVNYQPFILPAGVSTITKGIVPWNPRPKQFLKVSVFIHGIKPFKEFWERVCVMGGAKILAKPPSKTKVSTNNDVYIVTDPSRPAGTVPQSLRDLTNDGRVKLVSSDWLVESILHGTVQKNT